MATADTTIARRRPGAAGRRVRRIGARTLLYVVAWVAAIATLVPILYAVLGGFRDTGQLVDQPGRAARSVGVLQLHGHPQVRARSGARSGTAR